ncbi:hypothetical protein PHLCEN_2v10415 [Hermanssonia centrifuga]|uniref:TauD/TfdA-like domain-containing protein n=1 Tax=Hermanssonia centrifuga TaxID=98765 RepID=A0A2R6NN02_9APHY|nr:hypothetical protein PHLCEN_2v10415 [Hermanssonia centrifuga]
MVPAPIPTFRSLQGYNPVDETAHIGTSFPSDSTQLSALLDAENSDELIRDLATLVSHRGVVFFKNQDITIQKQKELGLRLGQLTGRPAESGLHKHPVSEETPELGADTSVISSMGFTKRILELYPEESDNLLDYLYRQISENHDLQVRYKWGQNDVAIWDNRVTFHTATNDYVDNRQGNRVVGIGEKPFFDPNSKSRRAELKLSF